MDCADRGQLRSVLLVKIVQIGLMLEIVGVQFPFGERQVRLHIVGELHHIQLIPLLLEDIAGNLQDFCVRSRRRPDLDHLGFGIVRIFTGRRIAAGLTSGQYGGGKCNRENECKNLFHRIVPPFVKGFERTENAPLSKHYLRRSNRRAIQRPSPWNTCTTTMSRTTVTSMMSSSRR